MPIVYLNGEFLPAERATVSVFDRGFLLGDGVYEVIPAFAGRLFRIREHLQRLQDSLDAINLENPLTADQWQKMLTELLVKNHAPEISIYLQVTRGVAIRDHAFPAKITQGIFAMANPLVKLADHYFEKGVKAITVEDNRWQRCDIKAISLLPNVLLRQQAVDRGAFESILIRDGFVTEGAAANVFIVLNSQIITPPKGQTILPGITRDLVIELAQANNLNCAEEAISEDMLRSADEVWLTSSTKEVLPVTILDDKIVGQGSPGNGWQTMVTLYRDYKKSLLI